jgi:hypothetical protein
MRRLRLIPLFVSLIPSVALAQLQLTAEAGGSRVQQSGFEPASAFTLGGSADAVSDRLLAHLGMLGALTSDDRWTGQWVGVGAASTPAWKSFDLQAIAGLSAFAQTNLKPTTSMDLLVQLRTGGVFRGAAIGGGGGQTFHNDVAIPVSRGVADAWWTFGDERVSVEASLTHTRSVFGQSSILVDLSARNPNYFDLSGNWRHERGGWSIGLGGGFRNSSSLETRADAWGSVDAAAWVTSGVAVVVAAGRTLEDLVRGVPRSNYASVGLRVSSLPHPRAFELAPRGARVVISRSGSLARIELLGVSASRVDLRADFTDWTEVAFARVGDSWRIERAISAGPHRMLIRVDGGEWIVPVNVARVDDDLAGVVGLITVP